MVFPDTVYGVAFMRPEDRDLIDVIFKNKLINSNSEQKLVYIPPFESKIGEKRQ